MSGLKQKGALPMQGGSLDEITFYRTRTGQYKARKKSSMDTKRFTTDPAFQRTRETMAEFKGVLNAKEQLCKLLSPITRLVANGGMRSRLSSLLVKIAKSDQINGRGFRNVMDGDASMLKRFEFSPTGGISEVFQTQFTATIDRSTGKGLIDIPAFIPDEVLKGHPEASHYQLHSALVEINFQTGYELLAKTDSGKRPIDQTEVPGIKLETAVTPGSPNLLLLLFGIDFHVQTNGIFYVLKSKVYNGLHIAEVSQE